MRDGKAVVLGKLYVYMPSVRGGGCGRHCVGVAEGLRHVAKLESGFGLGKVGQVEWQPKRFVAVGLGLALCLAAEAAEGLGKRLAWFGAAPHWFGKLSSVLAQDPPLGTGAAVTCFELQPRVGRRATPRAEALAIGVLHLQAQPVHAGFDCPPAMVIALLEACMPPQWPPLPVQARTVRTVNKLDLFAMG